MTHFSRSGFSPVFGFAASLLVALGVAFGTSASANAAPAASSTSKGVASKAGTANSESSSSAKEYFCYAPIFAYKTTAPEGWKLDTESGKAHNLCIVGYPEGGSWAESKTLVYFSAISKGKDAASKDLASVIENDLAYHKKSSPGVEVKEGETLKSGSKNVVTKHFFQQAKNGRFEAVGYIDEPKAVIMAVMTATSKDEFEKTLPTFKKLVESYKTVPTKKVSKL